MLLQFPDYDEMFARPFRAKVAFIDAHQEVWIEYSATYWSTSFYSTHLARSLLPGDIVIVVGRRGNSLLIMADPAPPIVSETQTQAPVFVQSRVYEN
jgi:hypothetical protein